MPLLTSGAPSPQRRLKVHLVGDSIVATVASDAPALALLTAGGRTVTNGGFFGETIEQQTTRWAANVIRGNTSLDVVLIQAGINNMRAGQSSATATTAMNALIADIRAYNVNAAIVVAKMLPSKTELDSINVAYQANWVAFNAAIVAHGAGGISAVEGVCSAHLLALDADTNFDLDVALRLDFLHPNPDGDLLMCAEWRASIDAAVRVRTWP